MDQFNWVSFAGKIRKSILAIVVAVLVVNLTTLLRYLQRAIAPDPMFESDFFMLYFTSLGIPMVIVITCICLIVVWWKD